MRLGVNREVGIAALDQDTNKVTMIQASKDVFSPLVSITRGTQLADCQTYVKTLLGDKAIGNALSRLHSLNSSEALMNGAQSLQGIYALYDLVNTCRYLMEGETVIFYVIASVQLIVQRNQMSKKMLIR